MTNYVENEMLLPEINPTESIELEVLEDKEHPVAPQITLKCGDAFIVADTCGDFLASRPEMGLFWHGTRFLRNCNLFLEGRPLVALSHHVVSRGNACQIDLTNTPFTIEQHSKVERGEIHVGRHLELQYEQLIQTFTITSFYALPITLKLSLKLAADFCDLFEVRGSVRAQRGALLPAHLERSGGTLGYRGLDDVERVSSFTFEPPADQAHSDRVSWYLQLTRGRPVEIRVTLKMREVNEELYQRQSNSKPAWHDLSQPVIHSSDPLFDRLLTRGMHDLAMLSTMTPYGYYPYAGIPWFSCPFGRDGLIAALEFLPWFPEVVRGTLAFLAAHQGTKIESFTDEEPGKILHEMRTGEMANRREIPYVPYYGTIDATPLFLLLLEGYIRWTDDQEFLKELWPHAEAAARWLLTYGDRDGDGFLEYRRGAETGLGNQGWKDSWDAIPHSNGELAIAPIALCEVQGYAYAAYQATRYLAERLGKTEATERWRNAAERLQENFLRQFWWEEEQTLYLALDGDKMPCEVVTTNAGHCLWTGIVPRDQAEKVISRLMQADMYSGWGLRTLSASAKRYNPMSYHNGSVWPHDTAIVGAGFAAYGGKTETGILLKSLYDASLYFEGSRLPELFCGFNQRVGYGPTRYPVACSPQAWAAGSPFLLLSGLLGFQPDAEHGRLILDHPTLPDWLPTLEISGMYVGKKRVHLRFMRVGTCTEVLSQPDNEVEIQID